MLAGLEEGGVLKYTLGGHDPGHAVGHQAVQGIFVRPYVPIRNDRNVDSWGDLAGRRERRKRAKTATSIDSL